MIIPIILCLLFTVSVIAFLSYNKAIFSKSKTSSALSANEFIEVIDIKDDVILTRTGFISILRIIPVYADLLSKTEEKMMIREITSDFSRLNDTFKFLCISRPIDIAPLLESFQEELSLSTDIRRELLKSEIQEMTNYALSGTIVERQFFILFEEKDKKDARARLKERVEKAIANSKTLNLELLEDKELIKFANLIYNPSTVNLEDTNIEDNIPIILY